MSNKNISNQVGIGERLRAYRRGKGLNGNDFAMLCGLSQGALSGLETGKSYPSAETIISLLAHTDIDIKWLLTGKMSEKNLDNNFLNKVGNWLSDETKNDSRVEIWFQYEFEEKFPKFKKWLQAKENSEAEEGYPPAYKVA